VFHKSIYTRNMSSAQERNIRFYEAGYLNALKKGLEDKSTQVQESKYDRDNRDNSSSSDDDEIQTRSKTTRKTERRNERNAKKHTTTTKQTKQTVAVTQKESASSPIVDKKLTKRQQVLQRYADEEAAAGAASVLASIADAAVTRSQARNRNTMVWTEKDRAAASRAADIALEVATQAAEAAQGKKKKEQPSPYWTRLHEKNRSTVRFQKEMEKCDFECDFY
jgi:hypothetical protein